MSPRISVLMAVHNGEKYLPEAVESILDQTFDDFEFIIVDDGSTDQSTEIIRSYSDPRIVFLRNQTNLGLTLSLNRGLDVAQGEYVARMDSDDISLPGRLARQIEFMDASPEIGACSTWAVDIDEEGKTIGVRQSLVGEQLDNFYWRTSLIHPAAMFRFAPSRELRYDPTMTYAQDYDLWLRIRIQKRLANLPEYLLKYRVHEKSVSTSRADQQIKIAYGAFSRHFNNRDISYEAFLAVMGRSYSYNPLRRALAMFRITRALHRPYRRFVHDDLEYLRSWSCDRDVGAGARGGLPSRTLRFLVRQINLKLA